MSVNQLAALGKKKVPVSRVVGGDKVPPKVPTLAEVEKLKFRRVSKREMAAKNRSLYKASEKDEAERERQEAEKYKTRKEKIGTCECKKKGDILLVTSYTSQYNPRTSPIIYGPGSRNQFFMVEEQECYCDACGRTYKPEVVKKAHK